MTTSSNFYLSLASLIILMSINGLATAVNLAVHKEVVETKPNNVTPSWAKGK